MYKFDLRGCFRTIAAGTIVPPSSLSRGIYIGVAVAAMMGGSAKVRGTDRRDFGSDKEGGTGKGNRKYFVVYRRRSLCNALFRSLNGISSMFELGWVSKVQIRPGTATSAILHECLKSGLRAQIRSYRGKLTKIGQNYHHRSRWICTICN